MAYTPITPPEDLQEEIRELESQNQFLENQLAITQAELFQIREQLKALDQIPLQVGTIMDVVKGEQKALVMIRGSNQVFRVGVTPNIPSEKIAPGTLVTLHPKTLAITGALDQLEDSFVRAMEVVHKPSMSFDQIGGLSEEITLVLEGIELSLTHPELFEQMGVDPPKGVLLHGPPGTGKTMIAKALANKTNATFVGLAAPELAQKFIGDGARLVREIFQFARRNTPAIIFIDEIDAIAMRRSDHPTEGNTEIHRTFLQLLAELDGFNERGNIKFVAATNRPDILDQAITRPGRFDRKIEIGLPSQEGREDIFMIHSRRMRVGDVSFKQLAEQTKDFNGAEIKAVCVEAGMLAIRDRARKIEMPHFLKAIQIVNKTERLTKMANVRPDYA